MRPHVPRLISVAVALLVALPVLGAQQQTAAFGDERAARHPMPTDSAQWVSGEELARRLQAPSGEDVAFTYASLLPGPEAALLSAARRRREAVALPDVLAAPGGECWYKSPFAGYDSDDLEARPSPRSFDELISNARAVIEGTVTGIEGGYYQGVYGGPGLLVQIEVRRWHKADADYPQTEVVHFFYPVGEFQIGAARVCAESDGWPAPPTLGSSVMLFPMLLSDDPRFVRIQGLGGEVAFDTAAGMRTTKYLAALQELQVVEFKDLRNQVRRAAVGWS